MFKRFLHFIEPQITKNDDSVVNKDKIEYFQVYRNLII